MIPASRMILRRVYVGVLGERELDHDYVPLLIVAACSSSWSGLTERRGAVLRTHAVKPRRPRLKRSGIAWWMPRCERSDSAQGDVFSAYRPIQSFVRPRIPARIGTPPIPGAAVHDAFLKSAFSEHRMVKVLIRDHVREWAGVLDFSTLREESTQLVSKRTLQRRHPDMIWSVDTFDGRKVVFLMEFQRAVDPLIALRTTTYAALTLEGIASDEKIRAGDPLPEFVYLVLYHGDHPWSAPDRVVDLFERSDPGKYRLVGVGRGQGRGRITRRPRGAGARLGPQPFGSGHGRPDVGLAHGGRAVWGGGLGRFSVREDVHDVRVERLHGRTDPTTGEDHG